MNKTTEKHYLARIDFDERISREDKLFGCLLFCGYPANRAYQIAYPTKADANSSAAMASRRKDSWAVQSVLKTFLWLYDHNAIDAPKHLIKNYPIQIKN